MANPIAGEAQRIDSIEPVIEQPRPTSIEIAAPPPSLFKHVAAGALVGAAGGFAYGRWADSNQTSMAGGDSVWNYDSEHYYTINGTLIGAAAGAALGALIHWVRR